MPLRRKVAKIEDVDEKDRGYYKKQGEGFVLDLDADDDPDTKVKEFRDTNTRLKQEVDSMKAELDRLAPFKEANPEEFKKAKEAYQRMQELEEEGLIKDGKVSEVLQRRVDAVRQDYDKQITTLKTRNQELEAGYNKVRGDYSGLKVETETDRLLDKLGYLPRKGAKADVYRRAREAWKVKEDGNLEGNQVFNGKGEPASFEEWGRQLLQDAPFLFESGNGGGAGGGRRDTGSKGGKIVVPANDPVAAGKYVEQLASGEAVIAGTTDEE